ncbi:hypothetical protein [Microbacterium xanthum]|nr:MULTISPECIES: hypothetical protein [unclassified Microbacterium]MDZ8173258.1 hypothetical protein [Microbacterium sp. KSW-48]MDZ8202747.1 hypothetical protein [Microbacterium sp. SSW1-59]
MIHDDGYGVAATPQCPSCATLLRPGSAGYWCATCEIVVIGV